MAFSRSESLTHRTTPNTSRQGSLNEAGTPRYKNFQTQQSIREEEEEEEKKEVKAPAPLNFHYNRQVWFVVAPCLLVLATLGGQATMLTGTIGLMCTYTSDIVQSREGTILGLWMTLLVSFVTVVVASASTFSVTMLGGLLRIATYLLFFILLGIWGMLQFQWMVVTAPRVSRAFERLLMVCLPIPAASIITSGAVAYAGPRQAPVLFALALYFCLSQLGGQPLACSFQLPASRTTSKTKDSSNQQKIHGKKDAMLLSFSLLVLPVLLHIAFHHAEVFTPTPSSRLLDGGCSGYQWGYGMSGVRVAGALSVLLSWMLVSKGSFWWTGIAQESLETMWKVLGTFSVFVLIYEGEQAVLLEVFRPYITVRAPYDFLYLISLTGMAILSVLIFMISGASESGAKSSKGPMVIVTALNLGVAYLVCELFGVPVYVKAATELGGFALSIFMFKRSLLAYLLFVNCAGLWLAWFASDTLGFLQFQFAMGLSVASYTLALTAVAMLGALLPAMVWLRTGTSLLGFILVVYTSGVAIVEVCLVDGAGKLYEPLEAYPIVFLLLTSGVGLWVSFLLRSQGLLGPMGHWFVGCLSWGKLVAVVAVFWLKTFGATGSLVGTLVPAAAVLLALTAAHVFDDPSSSAKAASPHSPPPSSSSKVLEARKLPVAAGVAHFLTVGLALSQAATPVLQPLITLFLSRTPSTATLVACVVLIWGLSLLSMVATFFPASLQGRRLAACMIFSAVLLQLIQPELRPGHILSSLKQPFTGDEKELNWAPLCLFAASLVMLVGSMGITRTPQSKLGRLAYSYCLGVPLGLYISLSAVQVPQTTMLMGYAAMTSNLLYILICAISPNTDCDTLVAPIFFAFLGTGFFAYLEQTYLYYWYSDLHDRTKSQLHSQEIQALFALSAVGSLIVALALKSLGSGQRFSRTGSGRRASGLRSSRAAPGVSVSPWIPFIGNLSACYAFFASLSYVHSLYSISSAAMITPFLCSILLLLQKDQGFFSGLTESNLLAPAGFACLGVLLGSTVYSIAIRGFGLEDSGSTGDLGSRLVAMMENEDWKEFSVWTARSLFSPVGHSALAIGCLPSFFLCLRYLWSQKSTSGFTLAAVAPLCLASLCLSKVASVNMLGLVGFAGSLFQFFSTSQHRLHSMQYI